ncbi:MAG: DEAD/DEAH box helicase [Saprospiraceae bacterium]|nr:DEAD/DEAH box helicase [Saprospiraceae bacterium]
MNSTTVLHSVRKESRPQRANGGNRKKQTRIKSVDPVHFEKKSNPEKARSYTATRAIADLPVDDALIRNLIRKKYTHPTEIQEKALEPILNGLDFLGIAKTGTGKTAAFLVPLLHNVMNGDNPGQILIITPTRELALQIEAEYKTLCSGLKLFSHCLIGGTSVEADIQKLKRPVHTIIGTPGRIADLVMQRKLNLQNFSCLVLDEFDRLLDMGFSKEVMALVGKMTNRKQTILFSATEDDAQRSLMNSLLNNPVEVRLYSGNASSDLVDQEIVAVKPGESKVDVLIKMLKDKSFVKVMVFAETKHLVKRLTAKLRISGIRADDIHGNKSQNQRIRTLEAFKLEKIQVLVATDVAARGLDITDVSHVINFQEPKNLDSYIHRIGRTGRAGKSGKAYTFVG